MSNTSRASAGAGGSGYISGHTGCIAIKSPEEIEPKVNTYSQISDSYHYSGKVFTNTTLTEGVSLTSKATITSLTSFETSAITNIKIENGNMTREFSPAETDYYIELDSEEPYPTIIIETIGENIEVEGGLTQTIETKPGETIKEIKAIDEYGFEYEYTLHFVRKPSSDSFLKSILVDQKEVESYEETTTRYEIVMPYWIEDELDLDAIKKLPGQTIKGLGKIDVSASTTIKIIEVIAEDGYHSTKYNLILTKQPNTKLKSLDIKDYNFAQIFESGKFEYEFEVTPGVVALELTAVPYDENAKVVIKGAGYIKEGKNKITITVSREGIEDTVYTINVQKGVNDGEEEFDFSYTGDYQTFIAPKTGLYKFEAWGARGGYARVNGKLSGTAGLRRLYIRNNQIARRRYYIYICRTNRT